MSTLPRAVRRSIEDAMLKMLAIHDIDKIQIPDPATQARREALKAQMYQLWRVTPSKEVDVKASAPIGADMAALTDCHHDADVFFFNIVVIAKGCKLALRCLHLLTADQAQDMLLEIVRFLLPLAYFLANNKTAASMELVVQLLVRVCVRLSSLSLSVPLFLSLSLSVSPSLCLSVSPSLPPSLSLSLMHAVD